MKPLGLVRISKKQIQYVFWVQQFCWKKNRKSVSLLFFLASMLFLLTYPVNNNREFTFRSETILISNDLFTVECQQYSLIIMCPTVTLD